MENRTDVRPARPDELDRVYLHGRDAWGGIASAREYLHECRSSSKYASGLWHVPEADGVPVASLIVYAEGFSLPAGTRGIGSVATSPAARGHGHASALVDAVAARLEATGSRAVWLHSDIDPSFHARLGFRAVRRLADTVCMVRTSATVETPVNGPLPDRF